jgi:hypothetical protein
MNKTVVGLVLLLVVLLVPWNPLLAAPLPPMRAVNHETRECGQFFGGDECMDCFPPEGWEVLGAAYSESCPEGYTEVGDLDYTCQGFRIDRCCTEGHSGAPGDCEHMVVNDKKKQCAFVEDIQACALPKGWNKKPETTDLYNWVCPENFKWLESLPCEAALGSEAQATATTQSSEEQGKASRLPCLGAIALAPALLGLWLVRKSS